MRSFVVIASIVIAGVITVLVSFSLGMESTVTESSNQISEDDGPEILPICGNKPIVATAERPKILLVSTLDGRLTALDPNNNGEPLWSIATGPGSMVSSTISQMELTNNAKWVRLIPSLAGGLYKFDGEVVEPIPLSAEELLRTSFKFADNTVMTGGKESRVYGIEVDTGRIKYECSMDGCFGPAGEAMGTTADNDLEDILVVRRVTQVVRAVEPRTGAEKWNFSVSTHHVSFQSGVDELCDQDNADNNSSSDDEDDLKAVVPEGVICKVDKARPDQIRWKQKFGSPIVHAWRLERGVLKPVNLFSNSHLPKVTDESKNDPSIYLGSYKQQLYIQESDLHKSNSLVPDDLPRISWKPYLISADSRTTVINHGSRPNQNELPMLTYDPNVAHDTALAVFSQGGNAEYPYDSGLYLYPEEANLDYDLVEDLSNATSVDNNDDVEEIVNVEDQGSEMPSQAIQIVFVSMWYWWQEIVLISLFTAAVMNIFITRPYIHGLRQGFRRRLDQLTRRRPNILVVERRVEVPYEVQVEVPVPRTPETSTTDGSGGYFTRTNSNQEFISRYLTDYEPVQCLGAGGFGVVFESKNKIDDNHYAVKRVRLPIHEEAKKKVMREVKCLAKLDQRNIVRYYHTWLEYPPPGWQEEADKVLRFKSPGLGEEEAEDVSETGGISFEASSLETGNPLKPFDQQPKSSTDLKPLLSTADEDTTNNNDDGDESCNVVFQYGDDDNDSSGGIVFKDEESNAQLLKPAPSRSISIVSMTKSRFWRDSTSSKEDDGEDCYDALEWDAKNHTNNEAVIKPPSVYLYIVMELCQKESLKTWLRNCAVQRNRLRSLSMFNEICSGVEYVHSQGVIHRDLKPSNIFFASDGTLKLGDFGLATVGSNADSDEASDPTKNAPKATLMTPYDENEGHTEEVGTELYMSPEQLEKRWYNYTVDIYSLGLILFELLVPFSTQMERIDTLTKLRKLQFPPHFMSKPEYDLVSSMLSHEPNDRPEATNILDLDFLRMALQEHEQNLGDAAGGDFHHHRDLHHSLSAQQRRRKHLSSSGSNQSH